MKIATKGFFLGSFYRLAFYGSKCEHYDVPENLCPFIRRVVWGVILCVLIGVGGGSLLVASVLDPVISLVLWLFSSGTGPFFSDFTLTVGLILWGFSACAVAGVGVVYLVKERGLSLPEVPKPKRYVVRDGERVLTSWGVVCEWWRAIHDKICPRIEFK